MAKKKANNEEWIVAVGIGRLDKGGFFRADTTQITTILKTESLSDAATAWTATKAFLATVDVLAALKEQ